MKYFLLSFLFLPVLFSCKKEHPSEFPMFSEPQPHGTKNERGFAKRYWGEYVSVFDSSSSYIIFPEFAIYKYVYRYAIPKVEYDTMKTDERERFTKLVLEGRLRSVLKNDTMFIAETEIDTAFSMKRGDILRYGHGHYYLNRKGKYSWYSDRLRLEKSNILVTEYLFSLDSIFKYNPSIHTDSIIEDGGKIRYATIAPTKRELAKLMKLNNLVESNVFRRRKNKNAFGFQLADPSHLVLVPN